MAKQIRIERISVRVRAPLGRAGGEALAHAIARELASAELAGIEHARALDRLAVPPLRVSNVDAATTAQRTADAITTALTGKED